MKKLSTLLITLLTITSLSAQTRSLGDFNEVSVSGSVTARLVQSNETKVDIKMIKGSIDDLITEVKGGDLTVKFKKDMFGNSKKEAKVTIYYKALNEIDASAGCSVGSDEVVSSSSLDIEASSGSTINLEVEGEMVNVDASSGSNIKLKGSSKKTDMEASSGSSINAKMLDADEAKADVSSGASISLVANKSLEADASSGGSIKYKGDPKHTDIDSGKYSGGAISKM